MTSTIKTLSAIIFGVANVMGSYSIDTEKVNAVYNDLLNGAGSADKLDTFIGNFDILQYCWQPAGWQCVNSKDEFKSIMKSQYFSDNNVIAKSCTITIGANKLSADIECEFTLQSTTTQQCTKQTVHQHMDYNPYATSIIQYMDMIPPTITNIACPVGRRLMSKYSQQTTPKSTPTVKKPWPINKCYDAQYKNPCNAAQRASGIYYFPSCYSCCNFIQCDNFGVAFERPCVPGTYWDQNVLTCNHNNGQCNDYNCPKTTTKPPTKWTTTSKPTSAPTTNKPTSPPTKKWTTTRSPTKWTKKPCNKDNEGKKW